MSECNTVTIRKAELDDMPQVFQMIKELSDFEDMGHKVKIDVEILKRDLAEKSPAFQCIVAEVPDGKLIGYAVYSQIYSTFDGKTVYLEDLYVSPKYRGLKAGKNLFLTVMKNAYQDGCRRGFFHVLTWNPAVKFYHELGAVNVTQRDNYQILRMEQEVFQKLFS
ncbi:unnamed protein product [Diabrotica balteata]|uniref:N-acetyltransferase domain-containing protein n=1 Tax=Diabrotica balteata TaxID=107213 RepID=A0A9N9X6I8_DIABA|nr:unnamed protein product [Diabrotica balteata]